MKQELLTVVLSVPRKSHIVLASPKEEGCIFPQNAHRASLDVMVTILKVKFYFILLSPVIVIFYYGNLLFLD